jgi:multimeric flavodoxin WrbA
MIRGAAEASGSMKITIFNGSPKAERGNTHVMVQEFMKGAAEGGAEVENVFLAGRQIGSCTGCYSCWMQTPGECIQRDAMDELLPKVLSTDILGFATPLYVDNVSGIMKMFLDRLIPIADPHIEKDEQGECRHPQRLRKLRKMVIISNCGFPEQSHFQVLRIYFRRVARNTHSEVIAEMYRGAGSLLTSTEPSLQPFLEGYKALLRKAGKEVAENWKLSKETAAALEKPLAPIPNFTDLYVQRANKYWDEHC